VIPRFELSPIQGFNLGLILTPPREWIEYPVWLGVQRDYYPGLHAEADWVRVEELVPEERGALRRVDATAQTPQQFDALAFDEYEAEGSVYGLLELGVTSLVYALNASGCVSASSCRGHPGRGPEVPWVLFAGTADRVALVNDLAVKAGPQLANMDGGGVALMAPSVTEMLALAEAINEEAGTFDRMPPILDGT
jgi:hypothetical protein